MRLKFNKRENILVKKIFCRYFKSRYEDSKKYCGFIGICYIEIYFKIIDFFYYYFYFIVLFY